MVEGDQTVVGGGMSIPEAAPKGRRFASALVDLLIIPIVLGVVAGLLLLAVPEMVRNIILIVVNIGWLIFRDKVFSPGRKMVGLKLISTSSENITIGQAFIRNILLIVPFVLVVGYIVEIVFLLTKGNRVADQWAGTRVVVA
ncbi:MAG: hypothetical protein A3G33_10025 [Omnitrophica bacterium RIFCSPLOWO2_12_FULL_44_17]|uniref:RDD domain-containing protein n=1 Tax=Candidatus Danuiimicrobium aquiferis TaxID=1801832 RepID=A0A1G1L2Q1_9BACT|nr:MAG: hypothetical protein A3B72_08585 [Omnitrophica bacterium RIFCSPHIGHO2_02_FULL_45_28]OGW88784.1 MAG: hypothetical protein A3E74_05405 [Omnitrophica bacterium RIFCSPHIGHO2_12_FULL_44_12]OGW99159.1 MAG: hypothetical protein A3G33_10025 [Omnitrophica bacterium RIFCSPLOWO2_12_FULL_44_17]OGX04424.1 MAG: hypothetical protein A3J12_00585 [Omnitrophica bacterium RIFCSPLOWO2_02_FULL_44_11]